VVNLHSSLGALALKLLFQNSEFLLLLSLGVLFVKNIFFVSWSLRGETLKMETLPSARHKKTAQFLAGRF